MQGQIIGVTGANGHLGAAVVRLLLEKGYRVKALVNKNQNALENLPLEIVKSDVCDPDSLHDFCSNIDIMIHCAGFIGIEKKWAQKNHQINVIGTKNVVNTCLQSNIKKLIYVSSIQTFKVNGEIPINEKSEFASEESDSYSYSKKLAEDEVRKGIAQGLQACIVNPTSIIGPYDFIPGAQTSAIIKIANQKVPALLKAGFDWVDVRDVAKGILGAMLHGENGANYILSGYWKTFHEIANEIALKLKHKPISIYLPISLAEFAAIFQEVWAKISRNAPVLTREAMKYVRNSPREISNQKAKERLHFETRPFEETITDTINWLQQQNWVK